MNTRKDHDNHSYCQLELLSWESFNLLRENIENDVFEPNFKSATTKPSGSFNAEK
jgi:hypothetical protein